MGIRSIHFQRNENIGNELDKFNSTEVYIDIFLRQVFFFIPRS